MGNQPKAYSKGKPLKVASLNYCGIMTSPFEFYTSSVKNLQEIGKIFQELIPQYFENYREDKQKKKFSWIFKQIDKQLHFRYSPMFVKDFGLKEVDKDQYKFMTEEQIRKQWQNSFKLSMQKAKEKNKQKGDFFCSPQQEKALKQYDLLMFHALLRNSLDKEKKYKTLKELLDLKGDHCKEYKSQNFKKFEGKFLNAGDKASHTLFKMKDKDNMKMDIFFFQDISQEFKNKIKGKKQNIITAQSKDTMIVVNSTTFNPENQINIEEMPKLSAGNFLREQLQSLLNCNKNTSVMVIQNFILLNFHFSSKDTKTQTQKIKKGLQMIRSKYPNYEIIAGGDFNSYLSAFSYDFQFFPPRESDYTTKKKRTIMQAQYSKADEQKQESKNKILSTLPILLGERILWSDQQVKQDSQILSNDHPYDSVILQVLIDYQPFETVEEIEKVGKVEKVENVVKVDQ